MKRGKNEKAPLLSPPDLHFSKVKFSSGQIPCGSKIWISNIMDDDSLSLIRIPKVRNAEHAGILHDREAAKVGRLEEYIHGSINGSNQDVHSIIKSFDYKVSKLSINHVSIFII
jgi:hypothetical protein